MTTEYFQLAGRLLEEGSRFRAYGAIERAQVRKRIFYELYNKALGAVTSGDLETMRSTLVELENT